MYFDPETWRKYGALRSPYHSSNHLVSNKGAGQMIGKIVMASNLSKVHEEGTPTVDDVVYDTDMENEDDEEASGNPTTAADEATPKEILKEARNSLANQEASIKKTVKKQQQSTTIESSKKNTSEKASSSTSTAPPSRKRKSPTSTAEAMNVEDDQDSNSNSGTDAGSMAGLGEFEHNIYITNPIPFTVRWKNKWKKNNN